MRIAGEYLPVRVLQPACHDLFVREVKRMLQIQQPADKTRVQNRLARSGLKRIEGDLAVCCLVDHVGQFDEQMVQVDMRTQQIALRAAALKNTAFHTNASLRQKCKKKASYGGYCWKFSIDLSSRLPHGC
jgi:hypothetical protein